MMGGVVAASRVLGPLGFWRIFRAMRVKPTEELPLTAGPYAAEKMCTVFVTKTALTAFIWRLEFDLQEAGASLLRSGLICPPARCAIRLAKLLISIPTGGDGSIYVGSNRLAETEVELPLLTYQLQRNSHRRVFVATVTGIAPFLPIYAALEFGGTQLG
jgi:all-trans-retinol 13,14-reductase